KQIPWTRGRRTTRSGSVAAHAVSAAVPKRKRRLPGKPPVRDVDTQLHVVNMGRIVARRPTGKAEREPERSVLLYVSTGSAATTPPGGMDRGQCLRVRGLVLL